MPHELPAFLKTECLVGGAWVRSNTGGTVAVTDPATGETLAHVPRMARADVVEAIAAADAAFPKWKALTAAARANVLDAWAAKMRENANDLARLLTLEQGKAIAESRAEVEYAASFLSWFAGEGKRIYGDTMPAHRADSRILVTRQPLGVCGGITPWNFPSAMVTRKAAPALAAGNCMVLKPAETTPLSALAIAALAVEAGVPPGVFNVVTGAREDAPEIGDTLVSSPLVRKIGFTGSTAVGKYLMQSCANDLTKVSLELGGNAAFIVFDDADFDAALAGAEVCKYRNSGQTCISANRILVQSGLHDRFVDALAQCAAGLKPGHGMDEGVTQGPLIEERALEKVERLVADALEKGARLITGGKRHSLGGTFYEPTVLCDVTTEMAIAHEEVFGPVAAIMRFEREADAIALANATPYGLAGYFYSRDVGRIFRVAEALDVGIVGVNTGLISTEIAPFGGTKQSGIGREGSKYGIDDWTELKYICVSGIGEAA
ncbi:NAD-dependent succinate-semialdehyde dehydrogenase [Hoeflea sp.]|uniref:NAD-dependent succinate-semialdehyde dehydrogenase n=1 Tax=Hoeflea sp. TaxID=1940281 RepID=UPI003B01533A